MLSDLSMSARAHGDWLKGDDSELDLGHTCHAESSQGLNMG